MRTLPIRRNKRTFYWRLGILHGDVWGCGPGRGGGMCRVEVKRKGEYPKSFLGAQEEQKRERGRSVGRIDRGVAVCFFSSYIFATWPWCSFGPTARGSARVQVICGGRRVMLRKKAWNDRGSRQPSALYADSMLYHDLDVIGPPFRLSLRGSSPAFTDPCHPSIGRKAPEKKVGEEKKPQRNRRSTVMCLSRHGLPATRSVPDMVGSGMRRGSQVFVFHVSFHGRSLFVGRVGFGREQQTEIPSDLSDCFSCMHSTNLAVLKMRAKRAGQDGGPEKQQLRAPLIPMFRVPTSPLFMASTKYQYQSPSPGRKGKHRPVRTNETRLLRRKDSQLEFNRSYAHTSISQAPSYLQCNLPWHNVVRVALVLHN